MSETSFIVARSARFAKVEASRLETAHISRPRWFRNQQQRRLGPNGRGELKWTIRSSTGCAALIGGGLFGPRRGSGATKRLAWAASRSGAPPALLGPLGTVLGGGTSAGRAGRLCGVRRDQRQRAGEWGRQIRTVEPLWHPQRRSQLSRCFFHRGGAGGRDGNKLPEWHASGGAVEQQRARRADTAGDNVQRRSEGEAGSRVRARGWGWGRRDENAGGRGRSDDGRGSEPARKRAALRWWPRGPTQLDTGSAACVCVRSHRRCAGPAPLPGGLSSTLASRSRSEENRARVARRLACDPACVIWAPAWSPRAGTPPRAPGSHSNSHL